MQYLSRLSLVSSCFLVALGLAELIYSRVLAVGGRDSDPALLKVRKNPISSIL